MNHAAPLDYDYYEPPGEPMAPARPKFVLERYSEITFDSKEEWLVKGIIPRQGVGALYGQSESLKSFLAFDLACYVAAGREWAGQKVMQAPAVYIAAEGAAGLRKRKVGFAKANPNFPKEIPFHLIAAAPNLGAEQGDLQTLIDAIEAAGVAPGLIGVDTLAQTLGSGDENGSGMSQFIANANALARHFKALVLVLHHVGLGDDQRLRGHSSLRGALDVQILCERTKGALSTTITLKKMKDEASDRAFVAQLSRIVIGTDSDGDEVSTLVVDRIEEGAAKASIAQPKAVPLSQRMLMDVIIAALEENGEDFRPDGPRGPSVRAVAERSIRLRYNARIAEEADADEDPDKLADRQRKSFKRAIEAGLKANRLMARQQDGKRLIWLP
jgi:RecA/RadA recombinase